MAYDIVYDRCMKYFRQVYKESRVFIGEDAPYHYFMAQIEQESSCKEGIVASDGGMGLAQFMPKTADWIHVREQALKEFGVDPQPFNPRWAIRALILYDRYCYNTTICKGWYFAFRGYNGGVGLLNKEIKLASSCIPEEVERHCIRKQIFCKINIEYPYKIFKKAVKYGLDNNY